jgi:hypothetical protein
MPTCPMGRSSLDRKHEFHSGSRDTGKPHMKETKLACMGVVHVWRDQEVLSSVNL